ncbi:hypothetical protein PoB_003558800 [Plakobranchus ocellatus]|uniref:Uncharacterized protein n=1 Tax=Plakobranchus ocellatus TaxID=259542 RepID=A0AAV4AP01_9GAST|nr:hypothetical protein PoB_003558800 [Plakobranchus ocellatus]
MPRLGGRPGGASSALRLTLDSERSPSVHYANWKETMLLQRQLTTLTRTEKALVHGITVDQKVAFRRFQNKLQRSKIANARMWNDKETEIELRDAGMRRLHSESHLFEDTKVDFLSKLEKRPYSAALPGRTRRSAGVDVPHGESPGVDVPHGESAGIDVLMEKVLVLMFLMEKVLVLMFLMERVLVLMFLMERVRVLMFLMERVLLLMFLMERVRVLMFLMERVLVLMFLMKRVLVLMFLMERVLVLRFLR